MTPDTSVGFNQVKFATKLGRPTLPWQDFLLIHAGELLPDGRPRFRIVLVLVARQNGKTEVLVILVPYWLFIAKYPLTVGTSTKLEYARETWDKSRLLIMKAPVLQGRYDPKRWYVRGAQDTSMWAEHPDFPGEVGPRYKIAAANEEGGRSLTIDRGMADELRQHKDYRAWNAFEPAHSHAHSQLFALSNAGSDDSVVLNDLRDQAIRFIETGIGDPRVGIFEWSSPPGSDPTDPYALVQANPRIGYGADLDDLIAQGRAAAAKGGENLTGFQTEKMCIRVKIDNPAIDPGAWMRCLAPGDLSGARDRLAACLDVSPDGQHVSLVVAAVLPDSRVRVEVAGAWTSLHRARTELPRLVERIRPRALGWFPSGPGAALAADITRTERRDNWPPRGTVVEAIRGDTSAACMGFEALVRDGQLLHPGDPLLDAHAAEAERMKRGDAWVFVRHGDGHVDALYAAAGAVHLARTLPAPVGKPRLVVAPEE